MGGRNYDYCRDYEVFVARNPSYLDTLDIDHLRATDYGRLDVHGDVYLDYTGGSLYATSQVDQHATVLKNSVFGNPHSANPTSTTTTDLVEGARRHVLDYFRATDDYGCVFTQNASSALKLVGESFPFSSGSRYLAAFDNHNSVNGIREFARAKGAEVEYVPLKLPDLRFDSGKLSSMLMEAGTEPSLFAYPAQSNFTGVKHPLDHVALAKDRGWSVLLDAAAFVPTNSLDLSRVKPDFVSVSFYKMFGYPTGVGALIFRRDALPMLHRPWFAGGTVSFTSVQARVHQLYRNEAAFEDGTLNYLSIPAVEIGLRHIEAIGVERIGERVRCLTRWLLEEMVALKHGNGHSMVRVYGPIDTTDRGGTVTFNLYDPAGHLLDYRRIEELAGKKRISLRTGCFCNPGAGEIAEGLTLEDMQAGCSLGGDINLRSFLNLLQERGQNKSAGAIRASFGIVSNFADAWRLMKFVSSFRDKTKLSIGSVTFDVDSCRLIRDGS